MIRPKVFRRPFRRVHRRCFGSSQSREPVRILFCGADDFSIYSLRAVHELHKRRSESVASIDVLCRMDKPVGRGRKQIRQVPIKSVAQELDLPLHQIDSFRGWSPPSSINLIVAVSFGLLVPSRVLNSALHGGLNIHPSMLPDLRGPAPIQHALLQDRQHTGVTLQTMHPSRFDEGRILDQTPTPGISIPDGITPEKMVELLGPLGAEMLTRGIEKRLWMEQNGEFVQGPKVTHDLLSHAPKILPVDRQIDWSSWTADRIIRYDRVIGRLWDTVTYQRCVGAVDAHAKRIIFDGPWRKIDLSEISADEFAGLEEPGDMTFVKLAGLKDHAMVLRAADGALIGPRSITIEGGKGGEGIASLTRALKVRGRVVPAHRAR